MTNYAVQYPLHAAAARRDEAAVTAALANGHAVNARDNQGRTVVDCVFGDTPAPYTLLSGLRTAGGMSGVELDQQDGVIDQHDLDQMLLWAAAQNDLGAVQRLVLADANVNACDNEWSPLHYAILYQNSPLLEILLAHGADIQRRATSGLTPLDLAIISTDAWGGHLPGSVSRMPDIINRLIDLGATAGTAADQQTEYYLHHHIACVAPDTRARPEVHRARLAPQAAADLRDIVHRLDDNGLSLLHKAVVSDHLDLLDCVLATGMPINTRDAAGDTVLHTMHRHMCHPRGEAILYRLLQRGADVHAHNANGESLWDLSAGDAWLRDYLVRHGHAPSNGHVTPSAAVVNEIQSTRRMADFLAPVTGHTQTRLACAARLRLFDCVISAARTAPADPLRAAHLLTPDAGGIPPLRFLIATGEVTKLADPALWVGRGDDFRVLMKHFPARMREALTTPPADILGAIDAATAAHRRTILQHRRMPPPARKPR